MTIKQSYELPSAYMASPEDACMLDNGKLQPTPPKIVLFRGGHGSTGIACTAISGGFYFEPFRAMVEKGYMVYGISAAGGSSWGNPASVAAVVAAIAHLKAVFGVGKIALCGGSMGGLVVLNALKTVHADVCGTILMSPACDLDWFHGTAGYTPAYAHPGATSFGGYTAEMESAASYNTNAAGWAAATAGSRVHDEYSSWHNLGAGPIRAWTGDNDMTCPIGAYQAFVAGANDPLVTLRTLVGAPHLPPLPGPGQGPPYSEYTDFLKSLSWS